MNGSWALNKAQSDSIIPFLKFVGVPWAVQQIAAAATPTRTFQISSSGMIDTQVTSGMMGRTQRQEWFWSETPMTLATGGTYPAFLSFDSEGRLVTKISYSKGLIFTVFDHVVKEGSKLTLVLRMICLDGTGNEVVNVKRVFNRSA